MRILLGVLIVFLSVQLGAAAEPRVLKVGAVLSLSGDAAVDGREILHGLELATRELAAEGIEVKTRIEDDQTIPKQSIAAMQRLLLDKPDLIIGPIWSFLVDATGTLIRSSKTCHFIPSDTSEITTVKAPNLFYGTAKNSLKAAPAADWLQENKIKKAAILVSNDLWGESHEKATFNFTTTDLSVMFGSQWTIKAQRRQVETTISV